MSQFFRGFFFFFFFKYTIQRKWSNHILWVYAVICQTFFTKKLSFVAGMKANMVAPMQRTMSPTIGLEADGQSSAAAELAKQRVLRDMEEAGELMPPQ